MNIDINHITDLAPPVLLMVALNAIGWALKQSSIPNKFIPLFMLCLGGGIYPLIAAWTGTMTEAKFPAAYAVVVGIAIGGTAVAANQITKIWTKNEEKKP